MSGAAVSVYTGKHRSNYYAPEQITMAELSHLLTLQNCMCGICQRTDLRRRTEPPTRHYLPCPDCNDEGGRQERIDTVRATGWVWRKCHCSAAVPVNAGAQQ